MEPTENAETPKTTENNAAGDFTFLVGSWDIQNHMLAKRLVGSDEWIEFPSTSECWNLFDGKANQEEIDLPTRGAKGMTLRLYDPARDEWSLYWASSRTGRLDLPIVGRFVDGVGHFYGDDSHEGQPVRARYIWSRITATSARWEGAFSADGELTWETNWVMDFTRRKGRPE